MNIRKAERRDISRICEILVFVKRINFLPIFGDEGYSFGELQVLSLAEKFYDRKLLDSFYVWDDGIVKGFIHVEGDEVCELYVDSFFQSQGIGRELLSFAVEKHGVKFLWAIEKNVRAVKFYRENGFLPNGEKKFEEGTAEYLIKLVRQ